MFLDEVDLDVSNEDPAQRRQHNARAGLDRVKGLNVASVGGTDSVMSKHKEKEAFPPRVSTMGVLVIYRV